MDAHCDTRKGFCINYEMAFRGDLPFATERGSLGATWTPIPWQPGSRRATGLQVSYCRCTDSQPSHLRDVHQYRQVMVFCPALTGGPAGNAANARNRLMPLFIPLPGRGPLPSTSCPARPWCEWDAPPPSLHSSPARPESCCSTAASRPSRPGCRSRRRIP